MWVWLVSPDLGDGDWVGHPSEIVRIHTQIVSRFGNFLHKNPNYLGGESTNSGPMSTHENMP